MNRRIITIVILSILLIIFLLSFYIKVPYAIYSKGVVYPLQELTLSKTIDGNLITMVRNNRSNSITKYSVTEFIRGDASEFILNNNIFENTVKKGDTLGNIYLNEDYFRLLDLESKLVSEQKLYDIYATGEKPEIINYHKELLDLALVDWEAQKKIFDRMSKLYSDSLISKNEYELAYNELKLKEHNYKIAESNLKAISSGSKTEQLNMSKSLIESYELQIELLNKKINANYIIAPFDGKIVKQKKANIDLNGNMMDIEEIVKIVDMSSLLVVMPIEFYESKYMNIAQKVTFGKNKNEEDIEGKIVDIDNTVQILKRRQVVFVTVEITDNIEEMSFNMFVDGKIDCGEITLGKYILRLFDTVTEN